MAREFLQNIKSENRLSNIRLIMPDDPVLGGQPSDNEGEFTSNTPTLDLACSIQYALDEIAKKANSNASITAGNGLSGGGTLAATRTITLGTPTKITATSTNSVTTTSHTHEIDQASTTVAGVVQLNSATNSTSVTEAATPSAVKAVMDAVGTKANSNVNITAGNGLSGGGTLAATRTITLGTPTKITATSTNSVTTTSHTHAIDQASTTVAGVVQLNSATNSTSVTEAATPSAVKAVMDAVGTKANSNVNITAGNGLSGGGTLAATRTITLGTPTKITATSTNSVTTTSHTHEIDNASTTVTGVVRLNNTVTSTSTTQAATANAVKLAYDRATNAMTTVVQATGTSTTSVISQSAMTKILGGLLKKPIDVMSSRTIGTLYTNSTGGIIIVVVSCAYPGGANRYPVTVEVDGVDIIPYMTRTNTFQFSITAIVPPNSTYKVKVTEANFSSWVEYR